MARNRHVIRLITKFSRQYGVDPAAALAVAMTEGGLDFGAVGDTGTSFGPFQLHRGGALPSGRGSDWANSPAGIEFAVRAMSRSGARGKKGRAAIRSIVTQFERPADPSSEIQKAFGYYGSVDPIAGQEPGKRAYTRQADPRRAMALSLINQPMYKPFDPMAFAALRNQPAPTTPTFDKTPAITQEGVSPTVAGAIDAARQQLGQKYVWGGESRREGGFDCSGLLDWAFRKAGVNFPGRLTTYSAAKMGRPVSFNALQPGDLIISNGGKHMTMYIGNGKVIAASSARGRVVIMPMAQLGHITSARRLSFAQ